MVGEMAFESRGIDSCLCLKACILGRGNSKDPGLEVIQNVFGRMSSGWSRVNKGECRG